MSHPASEFRVRQHQGASWLVSTSVAALLVLVFWGQIPAAHAGYLPETPEAFVNKARNFSKSQLRPLMAGLYNWFGVDDVIRPGIESGIDAILNKKILKVEMTDVPKGFPIQFERGGVIYERNVALEHAVKFTLENDDGKTVVKYLPFGKTPEGYAFAASVPAKDLAKAFTKSQPAPSVPDAVTQTASTVASVAPADPVKAEAPPLAIKIDAPLDVITEIACAFFDKLSGERKIMTWRAQGTLEDSLNGSAFDTCAAKKRSGAGTVKVVLEQAGSAVYAQSTDKVDEALVYRNQ